MAPVVARFVGILKVLGRKLCCCSDKINSACLRDFVVFKDLWSARLGCGEFLALLNIYHVRDEFVILKQNSSLGWTYFI